MGGKPFAKVSSDVSLHFLFARPLVKFLNSHKTNKSDASYVVNVLMIKQKRMLDGKREFVKGLSAINKTFSFRSV